MGKLESGYSPQIRAARGSPEKLFASDQFQVKIGRMQIVNDYGDWLAEHTALRQTAGVLDLSFRSRICLTGADRVRFLHGQVTNDIKKLRAGEGCYAALATAKGRMESDLNIFCLDDELLLDFEPGLTEKISQRLEKFIVADDVQVVDVAPNYGLLSVQGPKAEQVVLESGMIGLDVLRADRQVGPAIIRIPAAGLGEAYLANHPRLQPTWRGERPREPLETDKNVSKELSPRQFTGFDFFIPNSSLCAIKDKLVAAARRMGGRLCGWKAFETARIEAGIPRFGVDMDETNIPLECGIEDRAVSYSKGCYIGQEVINRIHSIGHVNKELCGLRLADDLQSLPKKGDKLFHQGKEAGYITSAVKSPVAGNIALGYVRREANQIGNELTLRTAAGESSAKRALKF